MKRMLAAFMAIVLLSGCSALQAAEAELVRLLLQHTNRELSNLTSGAEEEPGFGKGVLSRLSGLGGALAETEPNLPPETPAPQPPALQTAHSALPKEAFYGYSLLAGDERVLYERLCQAVEQCLNFISTQDLQLTRQAFNRVFQYMVQDNPQFFYLSKSYQYRYYTNDIDRPVLIILHYFDGQVTDKIDGDYRRVATADRDRIYAQRLEFNNRVAEVLGGIAPAASLLEKEKQAHDYVVRATVYDHQAAQTLESSAGVDSHAFSAYGALLEGRAVCEGYSEALQYLLLQMGIQCLIVIGESENQPHQWNMVELDGVFYHVDPTWNDMDIFAQLDMPSYYYFNMSDQMISADHIVGISDNESGQYGYPLPPCGSSAAYYYNDTALRVGANGQLLNDAAALIQRLVAQQAGYLVVLFPRDAGGAFIKNWMESVFWAHESPVLKAFKQVNTELNTHAAPQTSYYSVVKWGMAVVPLGYGAE